MAQGKAHKSAAEKAIRLLRRRGGIIRTGEALAIGIHPRTFYTLRDTGVLDRVSRGVYRLAEEKPLSNVDLVTVAARIPRAVICLISALAFHEITTQVPHTVSIALERNAESPRIDFPPVSVHRFSRESLVAGIEQHVIDGVTIRIYSAEKTLVDCFKFRNKVGMDVVLEALRLYMARGAFNVAELLKYARICRVERIMRPYLEAML